MAAEFNKDELVPPIWMDRNFFGEVMTAAEGGAKVEVLNYKITPGTEKGDHYASVMFRALVEWRFPERDDKGICKKSTIIKIMPEEEGQKKDFLEETTIFETEIGMYNEIMPKFHEMLRTIGDNTVLNARCIYHGLLPRKIIVFDDLVEEGYIVLRNRPANEEELRAVLLKRAKWDALSMMIIKENPSYVDAYTNGLMDMPKLSQAEHMTRGIEIFLEMIDTQPTLLEYKPIFEAFQRRMLAECKASFREYRDNPQPDGLYTLNHGDFHLRNMMFKFNNATDKCEDVLFIDFQACYVGPLVNDLVYLKYTAMSNKMSSERFEELLSFYLEHLNDTLRRLNYNGVWPDLVQLQSQMKRHRYFDIFLLVTFLPMMNAFFSNNFDIEKYMTESDYRFSFFYEESYIAEVKKILHSYKALGYFDGME